MEKTTNETLIWNSIKIYVVFIRIALQRQLTMENILAANPTESEMQRQSAGKDENERRQKDEWVVQNFHFGRFQNVV